LDPACTGLAAEERSRGAVEPPLDAHEEEAQFVVLVLVGVEDVGSMLGKQRGDAGNETFLVGAIDEQYAVLSCCAQF